MLRILVPLAGRSRFLQEERYQVPPPLIEVQGLPMIEWAVRDLDRIGRPKRYLFVVGKEDCQRFALDAVLRVLTHDEPRIITLEAPTQGALCSALMAVDEIDDDEPLLIANGDQIVDVDFDAMLDDFDQRGLDFGTACFESVHPRWSFVRLGEDGEIVETAEKRPISRRAIAGLYYFRRGSDFVRAAARAIERGVTVGEAFYTSQAINELILEGKRAGIQAIDASSYHSFYNRERIAQFEQSYPARMQAAARRWAEALAEGDLDEIEDVLDEDATLSDARLGTVEGRPRVLEALGADFQASAGVRFRPERIHAAADSTVIEYERRLDGSTMCRGVDVLAWRGDRVVTVRRYTDAGPGGS